MGEIAAGVAQGFGCKAELRYQRRYPATINDSPSAAFIRSAVTRAGSMVVDADPNMASEDFAFMLEAMPGAYLWLGAAKEGESPGLHSPYFDFNDEILPDGIRVWTKTVNQALCTGRYLCLLVDEQSMPRNALLLSRRPCRSHAISRCHEGGLRGFFQPTSAEAGPSG